MGQGESCRIGNLLVSRLCVVLLICAAKCVWFCVEQPGTSIMEYHTLFQRFIKIVAVRKLKFMMGDYGAPTLKPSILYSSCLSQLHALKGGFLACPLNSFAFNLCWRGSDNMLYIRLATLKPSQLGNAEPFRKNMNVSLYSQVTGLWTYSRITKFVDAW